MDPSLSHPVRPVRIVVEDAQLEGDLTVPHGATGIVLFAHGSGSSRRSPRNRLVAAALQEARLATLLFDLLTLEEEVLDSRTAHLRFDIQLLAGRLMGATDWLLGQQEFDAWKVGYFGSSTGAGAALVAAAERPAAIAAVVSRGGRPDLAGPALARVQAATLLIVGGFDHQVIELNRDAQRAMRVETKLEIIPGASHLFEEPGALEKVSQLASAWLQAHLALPQRPHLRDEEDRHKID